MGVGVTKLNRRLFETFRKASGLDGFFRSNETDSGLFSMAAFGINQFKPSGFIARRLVG
jgi:hypothetical protein